MEFKRAERKMARLRMAMYGISGSGKTYSALTLATGMGGRIAVIDTEQGSPAWYAKNPVTNEGFEFDMISLEAPFTHLKYIEAIKLAEKRGYNVIIVDSFSHAWAGEGGLLEVHDTKTKTSSRGNSWAAWGDVTPMHQRLLNTILQCRAHVIVTMRARTHHDVMEMGGKKVPVKIGLAPIQRPEVEYEFDCVLEISSNHYASASKDKTNPKIFEGRDMEITEDHGKQLIDFLNSGKPTPNITLATQAQLDEFKTMSDILDLSDATKAEWLKIANAQQFEQLNEATMEKFLKRMRQKITERILTADAEHESGS